MSEKMGIRKEIAFWQNTKQFGKQKTEQTLYKHNAAPQWNK